MKSLLLVAAGLFVGAGLGQWDRRYALPAGAACLGLALAGRRWAVFPRRGRRGLTQEFETRFLRAGEVHPASAPQAGDPAAGERRRQELHGLEEDLDEVLLDLLALLKAGLDGVHTAGFFLPSHKGGYYLRVWISEAETLVPGAAIGTGQGLVGQVVKEEGKRLLEGDIVTDSRNLYYYSSDEGIKSLAAVPMKVQGVCRGVLLVDSLEGRAFDAATVERLETCVRVAGSLLYHAYLSFERKHQGEQLMALSDYQRKFLENMSEESILAHVRDYMQKALEGSRYTILARSGERGDEAAALICSGERAEPFRDFSFRLSEKGLISLVFEKEQIINRVFAEGGIHIPRLSPREPESPGIRSLLAVPVRTDQGVRMALMVESSAGREYGEHEVRLLLTIARAAGFALSRAHLYQEKTELASRDGLTGLQNHRAFREQFESELMRAQRYNYPLSVLMIDIDFFKKVNDTFGHPVGDRVLQAVAQILSQALRAGSDQVARYGGEEFVCTLVESGRAQALETAERIRESVARRTFDAGAGKSFSVTLSIGGALFPEDARRATELLEKADKALYGAKQAGRNRTIFYN